MKRILSLVLLLCSMTLCFGQLIKEKQPTDAKYLAGAVPVAADGMVTFTADIDIPQGMSEEKAFVKAKHWLGQYFLDQEVNQRISIEHDTIAHFIKVGVNEWIVFKDKALVLDRTQMVYNLLIQVQAGKVHLVMNDIAYFYNEGEKKSTKYLAEELITDEHGLNKKKTDVVWRYGKFRIKTIDKFEFMKTELDKYLRLAR